MGKAPGQGDGDAIFEGAVAKPPPLPSVPPPGLLGAGKEITAASL